MLMILRELKAILRNHPTEPVRFILPDGEPIPEHFHISEVGHVAKRFVDCGGTVHGVTETCLLQTFVAGDVDHRLDGATMNKILDLGTAVLSGDELEVEVEYDSGVNGQYRTGEGHLSDERLDIQLEAKHTDCAAKEKCGIPVGDEASGCCG